MRFDQRLYNFDKDLCDYDENLGDFDKIVNGNDKYIPAGWYVKLDERLMFINMLQEVCVNCGDSHQIQIFHNWKEAK